MTELPDPRPRAATAIEPPAAALHRLAEASLRAATGQEADACEARIAHGIAALLEAGDGIALARVLDSAPNLAVQRHLWRALAREAGTARAAGATLGMTLFAIPVVIVAGATGGGAAPTALSGVLADVDALAETLREHRALAGNQRFTLANALVAADAIDTAKLPALLAACKLAEASTPLALAPSPIAVTSGERAHLRFLVGTALAAPGVDLLGDASVGRWGRPLAQRVIGQLAMPGVAVVALPRAAASLPAAVTQGRAAQREVAAQLFASSALREFRASVGEPVALISAHRASDAPGGGELRLSLASPLAPDATRGFRCPLYPGERVGEVAMMLEDLLRDCRIGEVRIVPGVHADRDLLVGGPLLFTPDTLPTPSAA